MMLGSAGCLKAISKWNDVAIGNGRSKSSSTMHDAIVTAPFATRASSNDTALNNVTLPTNVPLLQNLPGDILRTIIRNLCGCTSRGILQGISIQNASDAHALCSNRSEMHRIFRSSFDALHLDEKSKVSLGGLVTLFGSSLRHFSIHDYIDSYLPLNLLCQQELNLVSISFAPLIINPEHLALLTDIVEYCKHTLRALHLNFNEIDLQNALPVAKFSTAICNVTSLSLSGTKHIGHEDLLCIVRGAGKNLRSLELSLLNHNSLTDTTIVQIAILCPALMHVDVYGVGAISSAGAKDFGLLLRQTIRYFNFSTLEDGALSATHLAELVKACTKLRHVNIDSDIVSAKAAIDALESRSPSLRSLRISRLDPYDIENITCLTNVLPFLRELHISFSTDSVRHLEHLCYTIGPSLHVLDVQGSLNDSAMEAIELCESLLEFSFEDTGCCQYVIGDDDEPSPTSEAMEKMLTCIGGDLRKFYLTSEISWVNDDFEAVDAGPNELCGEELAYSLARRCEKLELVYITGLEPESQCIKTQYFAAIDFLKRKLPEALVLLEVDMPHWIWREPLAYEDEND